MIFLALGQGFCVASIPIDKVGNCGILFRYTTVKEGTRHDLP